MQKKTKIQRKFWQRRISKFNIILSVFLMLVVSFAIWVLYEVTSTEVADEWFETNAIENVPVSLPKDDGPHQAEVEVWNFNGHLKSESGNLFSFFFSVSVMNNLISHMTSHVSLNDLQTGKHYIAQRKSIGNSTISDDNHFEFTQGDWFMAGGGGNDRLKIATNDFSFDLIIKESRAPVLHGVNGIILLSGINEIHYYTRPRMTISGTLLIGDGSEKVTGASWFDHQWGDFSIRQSSRDWFGIQLNDGTDMMIYLFRDEFNRPTYYTGSITKNGTTERLVAEDFTLTPKVKWTSDKSNKIYPTTWAITVPKKNIDIKVNSINKNNEFDATLTSYNIYWKGPVSAQGSHTGLGFMELNYLDKTN